jgi:hypothetical protein
MAYAAVMRRILFGCAFIAVAAAGCARGPYESVFEDGGFRLPPTEFNTSNTGSDECPGQLLGYASQGVAVCNSAPQQCRVTPAPGGRAIVCLCGGADAGGRQPWSCR